MTTIETGIAVMKATTFRNITRITLTVSFCCLATCLLSAPSIIPELECVTGVSVKAYFVRSGNSEAQELIISLENEGGDTYIFQDDLTSSSLAVVLTLKNGSKLNLAGSREGSFKYKTLTPGGEHRRVISLYSHELKPLQINNWQEVEEVKPYWDPPELCRVSEDAVKAAMNEKTDLLVYADSRGGLNQIAQKLEMKPRQSEQRPSEGTTGLSSLPSLRTPAANKAPDSRPTQMTPNEELASSTPWSIIVVLIVAATGLLWFLVKKRK